MKHEREILDILYNLGIRKMYKGCEYILSGIYFISENETTFSPVTKILYVEIAKKHGTSSLCVEKNIRSVIELIWKQSKNDSLIREIFGSYFLRKRPSNLEFFTSLYDYIKNTTTALSKQLPDVTTYQFICPLSGNECEFCREFIMKFLKEHGIEYMGK